MSMIKGLVKKMAFFGINKISIVTREKTDLSQSLQLRLRKIAWNDLTEVNDDISVANFLNGY